LGFAPALRLGGGVGSRAATELSEHLLAVLREALSNAARHARATRVDVTVDADDSGWLTVLVRDNGVGPASSAGPSAAGRGLVNMAGRAEQLGGTFRLTPAADGGAEAEWRVPIPPAPPVPDAPPSAVTLARYPLR
ncbi:MAG: hypothetical protein J2P26_12335, partial [Nocardiopsaceae bacterium]|nr:hypothetical protein [Nocardiopsaceae bacterium]